MNAKEGRTIVTAKRPVLTPLDLLHVNVILVLLETDSHAKVSISKVSSNTNDIT